MLFMQLSYAELGQS